MCAWTAKSDRFGSPVAKSNGSPDNLGPGAYVGHQTYEPTPSHAPFGSTKVYHNASKDPPEKQPQYSTPAPGAYDPKLPKDYDSGLPAKKIPFSSSAPRENKSPKQTAPGPGSYNVISKPTEPLPCRTMGFPQGEKRSVFRSSSAPSIPRDHQCHGYEETGNGMLVRQGPRDGKSCLTGRAGDSAGPGHYDYQAEVTVKRTVGGQLSRAPARGDFQDSKQTPGPGHYIVKGPNPLTTSSSFVSQSERMSKRPVELPGPGQYSSEKLIKQNMRERYPELQYFGSTSERFNEASLILNKNPGPGAYVDCKRQRAKSSMALSDRFNYHDNSSPGPGQYDPAADSKTSGPLGTVSILGSTGSLAFGSMQSKRFSGKDETAPGPGAYAIGRDYEDVSPVDGRKQQPQRRPKMPTSVFKSEVPKDAITKHIVREGQMRPPPGAYNPPEHIKDTAAVMRLPPKAEGFLSAEPRIMQDVKAKIATAPGPGMYNVPNITGGKRIGTFNRSITEGTSSGCPVGMGFDAQSKRFGKMVKQTPGPGAYNTDAQWISKTYNIHFDALL